MTPTRADTAAAEPGSPAGTRARVSAMGVPVVNDSEHYNHEEFVAQVRVLTAHMQVVGFTTEELLRKHNTFVEDVEQGIGGLMNSTAKQWRDMSTLKNGCQVIEADVRGVHARIFDMEGFRAANGEKLDFIATAAQNFQSQVRDMGAQLNAKVEKVELETVSPTFDAPRLVWPPDLRSFAQSSPGP